MFKSYEPAEVFTLKFSDKWGQFFEINYIGGRSDAIKLRDRFINAGSDLKASLEVQTTQPI
jgi:hypothetical protein